MNDGRTYGGVSPADRVAQRRVRMLDAGLDLFGTSGFQRVTVRQICARAHVAPRNFYDEFSGTEDLLVAVYMRCMDQLESVVASGVPAAPDGLRALIGHVLDAFLRVLEEQPPLARVVWFEVLGVSDRVEAAYMERTETFVRLLDGIVAQLDLTVRMSEVHRTIVLRALVGGISEVARRWIKDGYSPGRADLVTALTALLLTGARMADPTGP